MASSSLQDVLAGFLASLGGEEIAPAAGPSLSLVAVVASALSELTAQLAGEEELVARARELRAEAASLAALDATAYADFLRVRDSEARRRIVELPVRIAGLATEVAELAARAAKRGKPGSAADAAVGSILAAAAVQAAALLVEVNREAEDGDALGRARMLGARASEASRRAVAVLAGA